MAMNTRTITCLRHFLPCSPLNRTWNDVTPGAIIARRLAGDASAPLVVQQVSKKVKQYGKLVVNLPWNVHVKPTDPHEYPDMDTLLVKLFLTKHNPKENTAFFELNVEDDCCRITAREGATIHCPGDATCLIQSPIQYDVDARITGDCGIRITSMVSDVINLETEAGTISGGKLQAKKIIFNSREGGSVDLKSSLQGNIEIRTTKNGSIRAEKCLGTNLEMTTENGDVHLGSNYCEKASFSTVNGHLNLNNLHMDASVDISGKGSLNVSCLDGSLQAKLQNGQAKVQLVRLTGKTRIVSEGPIHLIVPRENEVQFHLRGSRLSIDEGLREKGSPSDDQQVFKTSGDIPLYAETSDALRVTSASWAESLQLGNFMK